MPTAKVRPLSRARALIPDLRNNKKSRNENRNLLISHSLRINSQKERRNLVLLFDNFLSHAGIFFLKRKKHAADAYEYT